MSAASPDDRGADAVVDVDGREPRDSGTGVAGPAGSCLVAIPATAVLVVGHGKSLDILPSGMVGLAVTLAGGWLFQSNRGLVR